MGLDCDKIAESVKTISIHPPREGWDKVFRVTSDSDDKFQSTHPVRGGTFLSSRRAITHGFQSTHPVRGGTSLPLFGGRKRGISIHPPREGWDLGGVEGGTGAV